MYDKTTPVRKYGQHERDTGSAPVQVALLTERINSLTDHFRVNPKDFHGQRGASCVFLCALDRHYGEARRTRVCGTPAEARGGTPRETGRGLLSLAVRGDRRPRHGDGVGQRLDPAVLSPDRRVP